MKVVLITGCSSGIGFHSALAFAQAGHRVYASMRDPARAGRLRRTLTEAGVGAEIIRLDVTEPVSASAAITGIVDREGRLDVLVNNAGAGALGAVEMLAMDRVRAVFETNVFGVLNVLRVTLPIMRAQGSGVVINVSSIAGRLPGGPVSSFYAASKHALSTLTEGLAAEVAPFGIDVALVEPGFCRTGAVAAFESSLRELAAQAATPYTELEKGVAAFYHHMTSHGTEPATVAQAILAVADAESGHRLHYPVGAAAEQAVAAASSMSVEQWQEASRARMAEVMSAAARISEESASDAAPNHRPPVG